MPREPSTNFPCRPQVVDLADSGIIDELPHKTRHVLGVNVVSDLFSLVAVDLVFAALDIASDQIAQEAVQFDAGMAGARDASAAQATCANSESATVFLGVNVGGQFRRAEERVRRLIYRKVFRYAAAEAGSE